MKTYFIKTFGCQMNHSDGEKIARILENNKLRPARSINQADLVVFNTCGVRQMAEDRAYGQIHNLKKGNPEIKIFLTGCLANRKDVQKRLKNKVDLFFPIKEIEKIKNFIENKKLGSAIKLEDYFHIKPKYNSKFTAFVPIMTGCNNFCSYCVVPYARGKEISRPQKDIIEEIKNLIQKGYREIVLLGQNVNSYKDKKTNFSKLIKKIDAIPGHFWINFISSHPKDITEEFIETITSLPKVCEAIHLPIQAGDNRILKNMNRKYTAENYLALVSKIKKAFAKNKPGKVYSLTSDIIVGFPGETKKQFLESAKIMRQVKYDMVYFGQFSPRPGTKAFLMKDNVTKNEKIRREKELNEILKKTALNNNKKYIGKKIEVLIEKEKDGFYFGRTRTGKNIKIQKSVFNLIGQIIPVKITKASPWNLEGKITKEKQLPKIIVILGPTSSGKSDIAIKLAQEFNGEIISADSRQVFKWLDIGSGKVTKEEQEQTPHWLLDVANPKKNYNVSHFKKDADKKIEEILERGKLPIICGGTGFWIKSLIDNALYPEVKPNIDLRRKLEKKSTENIFEILKKLDPQRAKNIDSKNKIRLIRAIEIAETLGRVPEIKSNPKYETLQIGIAVEKEKLNQRIKKRLSQRFRAGLIKEIRDLHQKHGVSWKRMREFGLAYVWVPEFLKGKITEKEAQDKIIQDEKNYAKKQHTWFKKDKSIIWFSSYIEIKKEVDKFLK